MSYTKKPGGYIDNQALVQAMQANKAARTALQRILDEDTIGRARLYHLLFRAAHALGENLDALTEMERIRKEWKDD